MESFPDLSSSSFQFSLISYCRGCSPAASTGVKERPQLLFGFPHVVLSQHSTQAVFPLGHPTPGSFAFACAPGFNGPLFKIENVNVVSGLVVGGGMPRNNFEIFPWNYTRYPTFQRIHNGVYVCREVGGTLASSQVVSYIVLGEYRRERRKYTLKVS